MVGRIDGGKRSLYSNFLMNNYTTIKSTENRKVYECFEQNEFFQDEQKNVK